MNQYEQLAEENQRFWESLDLQHTKVNSTDFAALAEQEAEENLVTEAA